MTRKWLCALGMLVCGGAVFGQQRWLGSSDGNLMGRITPDGAITEFPIPTPNGMPRAIAGVGRKHLVR
jgi:hypothetical protein